MNFGKAIQVISALASLVLSGLASIKVIEAGRYEAEDLLILSLTLLFISIIISAVNGKDSKTEPSVSK